MATNNDTSHVFLKSPETKITTNSKNSDLIQVPVLSSNELCVVINH